VARRGEGLFSDAAWSQALQNFGEVTRLTVVVYGPGGQVARDPIHVTPLFVLFRDTGYQPGIFADCARQCLAQIVDRPAIVVAPSYGLAVVGTSLVLGGEIVGAAVAGYAFIDFCQTSAVERLARQAGVPFDRVWSVARITAPVPERRLALHGELLQVLGDAILRENHRTRQYEKAAELAAAAASKDEFLAVISHELRTPLTPILLRVQMLRGERDPARIDQALAVIERNVRLEVRLVEDLLDLSRAARGTIKLALQTCDLHREARLAVDSELAVARDRHVGLHFVAAEELLSVAADRDRLQQILHNILGNALKFTPAGGTITVTLRSSNGSGIVSVTDSGRGIAPEFLPFVFDMFRRGDNGPEAGPSGLGIGLALVRRLVELHGGDIRVSSAGVGRGTEVVVRLPLVRADPHAALSDASDERHAGTLAGLRILVVEDADDVRDALRLTLEALGAEVSMARDGLEALEAVASNPPDVVLCDLQMPRMDGFEFLERLHADSSGPHPPVIAITGTGRGIRRRRSRGAGFAAHLDKPADQQALIRAIETATGPH
jgi:signal transduction histidine kinase